MRRLLSCVRTRMLIPGVALALALAATGVASSSAHAAIKFQGTAPPGGCKIDDGVWAENGDIVIPLDGPYKGKKFKCVNGDWVEVVGIRVGQTVRPVAALPTGGVYTAR